MSGLMGTVVQGAAFGTGSAIAHRMVGAGADMLSGGSSSSDEQPQQVQQQAPPAYSNPQQACMHDQKAFNDCLQQSQGQLSACQSLYDALQQCQWSAQQNQQTYN